MGTDLGANPVWPQYCPYCPCWMLPKFHKAPLLLWVAHNLLNSPKFHVLVSILSINRKSCWTNWEWYGNIELSSFYIPVPIQGYEVSSRKGLTGLTSELGGTIKITGNPKSHLMPPCMLLHSCKNTWFYANCSRFRCGDLAPHVRLRPFKHFNHGHFLWCVLQHFMVRRKSHLYFLF